MNGTIEAAGRGMTRRRFGQLLGAAGALGLVDRHVLARAFSEGKRSLASLVNRTASGEGAWALTEVEGTVPRDLVGTLFRVCPGQRENHGVVYRHLFDGDAFVAAYRFRDGKVSMRARFVETSQRLQELKVGRMLYGEFGTPAPPAPPGVVLGTRKNQPSVNVIHWDGHLLGLSEGGHPTGLDPADLSYQGLWDFRGTLPPNVSFTAHPKFDPATGVGYGWGVSQGASPSLEVFRMERDGTLTRLHRVPLGGFYMIHDMLLAERHLVFVIPPVKIDLGALFAGAATVADALRYAASEPTRFVVLRRDGTGEPVVVEQPANMVFHHGNAFERDGKLVIDSILSPDGSVLRALATWADDRASEPPPQRLTRLVLDLAGRRVESRAEMDQSVEFPRFDTRRSGAEARYLYTIGSGRGAEYRFVDRALVRHDLRAGRSDRVEAASGRAIGEAVFVPHPGRQEEDRGWLLLQGYDAHRDRNFLEVRDAGTMQLEARAWTPIHFPLGFHGNFYE
jgi:all-trans-8'-apo-beta-carotenal 15,15'-oxygenase